MTEFYEPLTPAEFATVRHLLDRLVCQQEDERNPVAQEWSNTIAAADTVISLIEREQQLPSKFVVVSSRDAWSSPHIGIHACGCDHVDTRRREGFSIHPLPGVTTCADAHQSAYVQGLGDEWDVDPESMSIFDCALGLA